MTLSPSPGPTPETSDDEVISEEVLRSMEMIDLEDFCKKNGVEIPKEISTTEDVVDWLLAEYGV